MWPFAPSFCLWAAQGSLSSLFSCIRRFLTLALYTGPISKRAGLSRHTSLFSSSAVEKELYLRYASLRRVKANSLWVKLRLAEVVDAFGDTIDPGAL